MADVNTAQLNQSFNALTQEVQTLTTAIRTLLASQSTFQQTQQRQQQQQNTATQSVSAFEKELRKGRKTTAEQEALIKKAIDAKQKEIAATDAATKAAKALANATTNTNNKSARNAAAIDKLKKAADDAALAQKNASKEVTKAASDVENSFTKLSKKADLASMALAWFGKAATAQAKQLLAQNRANGGLVEGTGSFMAAMLEQQNQALKYGVTAETYANITTGARQMFNAMGGTSKGMQELNGTVRNLSIMTSSFEDGLRLATQFAQDFANKGIKPTAVGMQLYENDIVNLRRQTGLSIEQSHALFNSVAEDAESIDILRSARADEREAILRSQRALIQQSIAAGMSAEQAKEAAKMLNKMTAAKPLDRIKQAAKMRAVTGAMGIAGGEEAAQAIMAGKRKTPQQEQALQRVSQQLANAYDQSAGQGFASELFVSTLYEKLDMEQYYGKNSNFSTTLGDSLKSANADLSKQFVDVTKDSAAGIIEATMKTVKQLELIADGQHWLGPIAAGVGAIVATVGGKAVIKGGTALVDRVLGRGAAQVAGKAATATAEGAAAGTAGAANAAGTVKAGSRGMAALGTAGKILGPAASIGIGAYEGVEHYNQTGKMGESVGTGLGSAAGGIGGGWGGALAGSAAGAALGSVVPILGTAVGGVIGGIIGGIGGGVGGSMLGGKGGKWVGGMFDSDQPNQAQLPTSSTKSTTKADQTQILKEANSTLELATTTTASGITEQIKKMDASNALMKSMVDLLQKQTELAEKQLIALTMSETEKSQGETSKSLRSDTKLGARYNYAM